MEDVLVYAAVKVLTEAGKHAYKQADQRVQVYADDRGITKGEAWAEIRDEARRRGDRTVEAASDWAIDHPMWATVGLGFVPVVGPAAAAALLQRRLRRKRSED